jgi:hypothetical protein
MILLATILNTSFLPEATAHTSAPTTTVSITPESGHVGDVVRVFGEINTTDGPYLIFFDKEEVKDGTATGLTVNDTFIVPPRPMGNYTVTLHDVTTRNNFTSAILFNLQPAYHITAVVPSPPEQLQEGESTKILVNVTGGASNTCYTANVTATAPKGAVYFNDALQLSNTTNTGYGEANLTYPFDFSVGAHTNYTGTYHLTFNQTLATANFTVGLTDKLEYRRIDSVHIQAAGFTFGENVTVNISHYTNTSLIPAKGYPQTEKASDGVVTHLWQIPDNATLSTYNLTLAGTITDKPVKDSQNFIVIFIEKPILNQSIGGWETPVRIIGEIATFGGNYSVLWDGESIREGTCATDSGVVNDTFTVPISVKGDHHITLYDIVNETESSPSTFEVTTSCYVSATPARIQEGLNTTVTLGIREARANKTYAFIINVTDPQPFPRCYTVTRNISTDLDGLGQNSTLYYGNFPAAANTNYLGTYNIAVIAANKTLATGNFTVGLTDRAEYVRRYLENGIETNSIVSIRASGYHENETATINITYHDNETAPGKPVKGYPKSVNASAEGVVTDSWSIPYNATLGAYTVALVNATPIKPKVDIQNFTLIEITVYCQPQNKYDASPSHLPYVSIGVYDEEGYVGSGISNSTGWVDFLLDRGNYTFIAFWKGVLVGSLNGSTTETITGYFLQMKFYIKCELARIKMVVSDESVPPRRLPFINVKLISDRTTDSFETNYEGTVSTNTLTNITYRIEARRYGHLFFNQSIGNLTVTLPQINIICPTYTLFVSTLDSKERPIPNAIVRVIEWDSGRIAGEGTTNQWGSIRFDCTFGRYKVRVYNLEQTAILKERVEDVIQNQFYLVLHCKTMNLDLSVKVIDYFGQPIPNALVRIERRNLEVLNLTTGPDGTVSKHGIFGGDYRMPAQISLYVAGRLSRVKSLYLNESTEIIFHVSDYVMVGGHPLASNHLFTGFSLAILILCALALIYRRRLKES